MIQSKITQNQHLQLLLGRYLNALCNAVLGPGFAFAIKLCSTMVAQVQYLHGCSYLALLLCSRAPRSVANQQQACIQAKFCRHDTPRLYSCAEAVSSTQQPYRVLHRVDKPSITLSAAELVSGSKKSELATMPILPSGTVCLKQFTAAACAKRTL